MTRRERRPSQLGERIRLDLPDFDEALSPFDPSHLARTPQRVATAPLVSAMTGWFSLILLTTYVAAPLTRGAMGLLDNVAGHMLFNIPAFMLTAFVVTISAAVLQPAVRLHPDAPRDPVLAATGGGLLTWALLHNLSPLLQPFTQMTSPELLSFLAVNVVEMGLIGVMLASFTRSSMKAFALGALVQALMLGMVSGLLIL